MGRHYQRGIALYELGRFREAVAEFTAELGEQPSCANSYGMLGACLGSLGELNEAEEACGRAIEIAPESYYAYYVLGTIKVTRLQFRKAQKLFNEAARLNPTAEVLCRLSKLHLRAGRHKLCLEVASQALAKEPRNVSALVMLSKALAAMGYLSEAKSTLGTALAIDAENAEIHHELGSAAFQSEVSHAALVHLTEARRIDPIKQNDRMLLAAAYGRCIFPLNRIATTAFWLNSLSLRRRWLIFATVLSFFALCLVGSIAVSPYLGILGAVMVFIYVNYAILLLTYDGWAKAFAVVTAPRTVGLHWGDYPQLVQEVAVVMLIHCTGSMGAALAVFEPIVGSMVLSGVLLLWDPIMIARLLVQRRYRLKLRWAALVAMLLCAYLLIVMGALVTIGLVIDDRPMILLAVCPLCLVVSFAWMELRLRLLASPMLALPSLPAVTGVRSFQSTEG